MRVPSPIEVAYVISSVSPARRSRRLGVAVPLLLALAACTPAAAPTPAPTMTPAPAGPTAAPTGEPTASPARISSADASPAVSIGRVPASPAVDRLAADMGSQVCIVNRTAVWIEAARRSAVVDPRAPRAEPGIDPAQIRPGDSWCTEGRWSCGVDPATGVKVDVCGFVTIPGGRVVAFQALRWLGESLFAFDDDAGSHAEDSWAVGERQSIVTGGYTITGERLADRPSSVVFTLTIGD